MKKFLSLFLFLVAMIGCDGDGEKWTVSDDNDSDSDTGSDTNPHKSIWCGQDLCEDNDDCNINNPEYHFHDYDGGDCDAWYCLKDIDAVDFMGNAVGTCVMPCLPEEPPHYACPAVSNKLLKCYKTPDAAKEIDPDIPSHICGY